jgi:hypothetical protein
MYDVKLKIMRYEVLNLKQWDSYHLLSTRMSDALEKKKKQVKDKDEIQLTHSQNSSVQYLSSHLRTEICYRVIRSDNHNFFLILWEGGFLREVKMKIQKPIIMWPCLPY